MLIKLFPYVKLAYRKVPKISPRGYIFEGLIFGGAYFRNFTVADEHVSENELKANFCRPSTKSPERYFKLGFIE